MINDFDENINRREVPALKVHPRIIGEGDLFAAGVADMDFRAPQVVIDALQKRLDHGVFGYETLDGGLMPSLINWLDRRHGWKIEEQVVLRAPNVLNALAIAASLFTEPGDGIIVQPPVFFDFFDILNENHRNIISNPLVLENGRYSMDFEDLQKKASDPRCKMIYLCNPHNPVGRAWDADELKQLGDICTKHGVLVVSDEMHGDLVFKPNRYVPFASLGAEYAQNSITCISPAKSFNIAACCSAFTIIENEVLRKAFQVENSRLTVNKNNAFANVAMQTAYESAQPWLDEVLNYLQGNIDLVRNRLKGIPVVELIEPEGTFLLWMDFRGLELSPDELTDFLKTKAHWAVSRGHAFGEQGAGFARVNIACPRAKLEKALDHLAETISNLTI